ncbi:MAG: DUF3795 domain-containing protein [Treponemataceae bacterium]
MEELIAYCGLDCVQCDARKATLTNDDALRAKTAANWSKEFSFAFTPAMINCTGCQADGAKVGHCGECEMRICGLAKGVKNCGVCAEYSTCAKIGDFLKLVPQAKTNLDEFRARR